MKCFIYIFTFIPHGLIRSHKWPVPNVSGFIAQLVRPSQQYLEVTGSNSFEILNLSGFYTQYIYVISVNNCEDHSLLDFTSAVQYMKYFILFVLFSSLTHRVWRGAESLRKKREKKIHYLKKHLTT